MPFRSDLVHLDDVGEHVELPAVVKLAAPGHPLLHLKELYVKFIKFDHNL